MPTQNSSLPGADTARPGWSRQIARRIVAASTVVAVVAGGIALSVVGATTASAALSPVVQRSANTATADALPTAQIDGVAWTQVINGNTVYVGGKFTTARPAGAAAGTNTVPRGNIMSYNLTTGAYTTFAPQLNAQVYALAVSPDGSRLYVGGQFTSSDGTTKARLAAYSTSTGALITSFNAKLDYIARAIVVTDSTVYVGGSFSTANGVARSRLAAFDLNGNLLNWAPSTDNTVNAMVLSPDKSRIIIGGSFATVNGQNQPGMTAVDAQTGAVLPWAANQTIVNYGDSAAILSLKTDGTSIFGTGYTFGPGYLEGTFKADPNTGAIQWIEDCHGDTYDVWPGPGTVYTVSHAHYCGNVGGFFQSDPWSVNMRHAVAFTTEATGTVAPDPLGYHNFAGNPSPSMVNWFPDLEVGTATGKTQAAWTVTGNSQYVVMGGEFPMVNRVAQQGLVRFALPGISGAKVKPSSTGRDFTPSLLSNTAGTVRVSWQANSDPDDLTLTYKVVRDGNTANPVFTTTADSTFWNEPRLGFIDKGLAPGSTHIYRLYATDGDGNTAVGDPVSIAVSTDTTTSPYADSVLAANPNAYWRMGESTGSVAFDQAGFNDASVGADVTHATGGAILNDPNTAYTFTGSGTSTMTGPGPQTGPQTYTVGAWFRTTSTSGGKIVGFGNAQSGNSGSYDRHVYLSNDGRVYYGVYNNSTSTLNTGPGLNDGQWHQVVASLGNGTMTLWVDGKLVGSRGDVSFAQDYAGYWRVGGDNLNGWPNQPASNNFAGDVDEVAVYPTVLTKAQVVAQYKASGRTNAVNPAPADAYGKAVYNDDPSSYWRFGETSGTTAADSGPYGVNASYQGGVILGSASGVAGGGTAARFNGVDGQQVVSNTQVPGPSVYSVEAWFNTTSNLGGKIIGFGCAQTGRSGCWDRHVFMNRDGTVVFGAWTGQENLVSSTPGWNDGKWHHVVATQGPDGMKMYLDGSLVGTNPQTAQQPYDGWWRVGGDNSWGDSANGYFTGSIDEAAVYSEVLSPTQVSNHWTVGKTGAPANVAPTADFTATPGRLTASFNASASTDSDGTIASYSWDFGDNSTGTGVSPTHAYAAQGTYQVTLTVTDNAGATTSVTKSVVVQPANVAPTAAITSTVSGLKVDVSGTGSSDPDGSIASYSWNFGDGTTATGPTASRTYTSGGSKTITLTVTDNEGATSSTSTTVTVAAPNQAPTASFTATPTNLTVAFDGTGSTDADGTIASYAWDFGDGTTSTSPAPSKTYATAGAKTVTLTVTDNSGATSSVTKTVTVSAANQAPTASFTAAPTNLSVAVDASGSADADGSVASYAWNFGDTGVAGGGTATGKTASYSYAAAGTYTVTLTVTDDKGATGSTTKTVTVSAPPAGSPLAADAFGRTSASGFGSAETGGAYTVAGTASNYTVSGGTGNVKTAAGATTSALLNTVKAGDADLTVDVALDKAATGGGVYTSVIARRSGNNDYRAKLWWKAGGSVVLQLTKNVSGVETTISQVTLPGVTVTAGQKLTIRFQVIGSGTTTLNAKAWLTGTTEPAAWQLTATDATTAMQAAGGVGLVNYMSGSATNAPVTISYDNLAVTPLG